MFQSMFSRMSYRVAASATGIVIMAGYIFGIWSILDGVFGDASVASFPAGALAIGFAAELTMLVNRERRKLKCSK